MWNEINSKEIAATSTGSCVTVKYLQTSILLSSSSSLLQALLLHYLEVLAFSATTFNLSPSQMYFAQLLIFIVYKPYVIFPDNF
jgi:hypothetical protein